ncbi:MAG: lytic murein transglycosylase [Candidatus Magasanikbacteria bacterium]|nr:lytic murein transglycosylase [Candidatus Magasanikbacteria bacterium]
MKKYPLFFIILALVFLARPIFPAKAAPDAAVQAQLEQDLKRIEAQIADFEQQLAATKGEKQTLANKIKQLKKEQAGLQLKIKATAVKLQDIQVKLKKTEQTISVTQQKHDRLKNELASLLRQLEHKDRELFLLSLTARGGLSDVFVQVKNYELLALDINRLVKEVKAAERALDEQHAVYADQKDDTQKLLTVTNLQQNALAGKLTEQSDLLKVTQGQETAYQNMLQDNQRRAANIRSRIYELLGVGTQINFGQAVSIAQWVSAQTGVTPAFLLAILTQESNLGKNVGTCNRPGDPPEKSWKVVMKPDRDQEPFLAVTKDLGRDPDITPVSCPMRDKKGNQIGWGGAMGPAQFIPSTWVRHTKEVMALTGKSQADPWDIRDAFIAAAVLLKANGADATKDGQWKAAMRYFSGGTNARYRFYGDNVLTLTAKYEQDIKDLSG